MAITDDILNLANKQDVFYQTYGRYIQGIATPLTVPAKGSSDGLSKLIKPGDEEVEIEFTPTAGDYQFAVDVWAYRDKIIEQHGYTITAKRGLGDGIIETLTKECEGELKTINEKESENEKI